MGEPRFDKIANDSSTEPHARILPVVWRTRRHLIQKEYYVLHPGPFEGLYQ